MRSEYDQFLVRYRFSRVLKEPDLAAATRELAQLISEQAQLNLPWPLEDWTLKRIEKERRANGKPDDMVHACAA